MVSISMQRDLIVTLKRETVLNVGVLSKLQAMPPELSRQMFTENALEKPTQNMFNHLAHYLVGIMDTQASSSLPWPLYDTKTERAFRNALSSFITVYSSKGLLSPVMSSYLVNPGCYKVTVLIFQMSQLAVKRLLESKMNKDRQKKLYDCMTEKFKMSDNSFIEVIEKETRIMSSKFVNYLVKRQQCEKIAELFRNKIKNMEDKLKSLHAQKYLDDIVDEYIKLHTLTETAKADILKVKNVTETPNIFEEWLTHVDSEMCKMESTWEVKMSPFVKIAQDVRNNTQMLIARHTGEAEKDSYMIEYNPKTDEICTKELEAQVNSEQKYILKNIFKGDRLNFPNLIRGFLIAIGFILKNADLGDDVYRLNEYLESSRSNYKEMVQAMRVIIDRVMTAEAKLEVSSSPLFRSEVSLKEFADIPPMPDLSELRTTRVQSQVLFDTFTPLGLSKYRFNLRRNSNTSAFLKPQSRSMLITPFHQAPKEDFMKSLISCRVSAYDRTNVSQNFHNLSVISQVHRGNETIAECSGFTKQQVMRLLSTKKSSSSKKFKYKTERPDINIKKGGLFNESNNSNESNGLFRSYSSPNLFENRDKRPLPKGKRRKLSIMQEDSPSLLEVSGIAALDKDSFGTPNNLVGNSKKLIDACSLPVITVTPEPEQKFNDMLKDYQIDLNKEIFIDTPKEQSLISQGDSKTETPKNTCQMIRKTSSLEKIINRFKKVRANVVSDKKDEIEFQTILEEKENANFNIDVFTANKVLLPDLLSPSCSVLSQNSTDYLDKICMDMDEKVRRKPRESLGTALGVDQTFLDQFDLID